jgi:hypothetical protein
VRLGVEPHPRLLLPPGVGGCLLGRTHRTPSGGEEEAWMRVNGIQLAALHAAADAGCWAARMAAVDSFEEEGYT